MKLKGIAAGAALFVIVCLCAGRLQAESYFHLQHEDGRIGVWQLDAFRLRASLVYEPPRAVEGERLKGVYDFDGNGEVDLVFEGSNEKISVWLLESGTRVSVTGLGTLDEDEQLLWIGDWNSGRSPELLTINRDREINRRQWSEVEGLSDPIYVASADAAYRFVAATDLDGDGLSDLMMLHAEGGIAAWLLGPEGGFKETLEWEFETEFLTDWEIVGAAHFDETQGADVVWQHSDGRFAVWLLSFPEFHEIVELAEAPDDAGWRVAVVGSVNTETSKPPFSSFSRSRFSDQSDPSPVVYLGAYSNGNPDAETTATTDRWWRQHGTPFLELWLP